MLCQDLIRLNRHKVIFEGTNFGITATHCKIEALQASVNARRNMKTSLATTGFTMEKIKLPG